MVNLYLGNDGPDLSRDRGRSAGSPRRCGSPISLATWSTWSGSRPVSTATSSTEAATYRGSPPPNARGGEMVDASAPLRPDDRQLTGPIYTQEGSPGSCGTSPSASRARPGHPPWSGRGLRRSRSSTSSGTRRGQGRRMVIALYPSVLQVYPEHATSSREAAAADRARRAIRPRSIPCRYRTVSCSSTAASRRSTATTRRRISPWRANNRRSRCTRRATRTGQSEATMSLRRYRPAGSRKPCVPRFRSHLGLTAFEAHLRARPPDHRSARGHWPPTVSVG